MAGYVNLPAYQIKNALLDFSSLDQGIGQLGETFKQNRLQDERKAVGAMVKAGDYTGAAKTAFDQGNLDTGLTLSNAQRQIEQDRRSAARDARDAENDKYSRQLTGLKLQEAQEDLRGKFVTRVAGVAQYIKSQPPEMRKALTDKFMAADPRFAQQLKSAGVDASNPDSALDYLIAEANGYRKQEVPEYGTTPQYYRDAEGNLQIGQMSKQGGMRTVQLPAGSVVLPGVDYKDTGTAIVGLDKRTGQTVSQMPKDIAGREAAEAAGKAAGAAQASLPAAKTTVESAFQTIDKLRTHPGLPMGTGLVGAIPNRPGSDAYDFTALNKQAQGQSFMAAREALKGAGQVTDFEGTKGEQAIANLDTAQSKEQYLAALDTLERMMKASYDDLVRKSQLGGTTAPSAPLRLKFNPETGDFD